MANPNEATRRRPVLGSIAVAVLFAFVAVGVAVDSQRPGPNASTSSSPSATSQAGNSAAVDRPSNATDYRPNYHITPDKHWMNDPQRPFLLNGVWHYYFLYNSDHPTGNGTEWYHLTSTDLVHWKDEGVAIPKFRNGLGDIETGSAVVDENNDAGFGKAAVVAVATQQLDGVQRQSLFYSVDGGNTFSSYDKNPVMDNPGQKDWRDPKIIRDQAHNQWVLVLAEGHKLGMYTSRDLRNWTYVSGFEQGSLGTLECPDLFPLNLDGDLAKQTWVLMAGANGEAEGRTTGTVYWTGTWDGTRFTPSDAKHQWVDDGSDFYAAVSWDDPRLSDTQRKESRHLIGWMNNWSYARDLPTGGWFGADSIIRDIRLSTVNGKPTLVSTPSKALDGLAGTPSTAGSRTITESGAPDLPQPKSGAYRLDVTLQREQRDDGEARVLLRSGGETFATVGYNFRDGKAFVARDGDTFAKAKAAPAYKAVSTAAGPKGTDQVTLTVFVDYSSVEVFLNGGQKTLTSLTFPKPGVPGLELRTAGGDLTLKSFSLAPMGAASPAG